MSDEWKNIEPEKPLTAITGGASIRIDVTKYMENKMSFDEAAEKFPDGSIKGKLITDNGQIIEIENTASSHNKEETRLILDSDKPIPTDIKITMVSLKSSQLIKDVEIYWKNFQL